MFRPRFRLSLLFIVVALVAGVSVWLRQAVVRDRNIRELLAEEFAKGTTDDKVSHLNTKLLNIFSGDNKYCDRIFRIHISTDRIDSVASFSKYNDLNLGDSVETLTFGPIDRASKISKEHTIALGQIYFWLEKFRKVELLGIGYETIVDDALPISPSIAVIEDFYIHDCDLAASTLKKFLGMLTPSPSNIVLDKNQIQGKLKDLENIRFSKLDYETLETRNVFLD